MFKHSLSQVVSQWLQATIMRTYTFLPTEAHRKKRVSTESGYGSSLTSGSTMTRLLPPPSDVKLVSTESGCGSHQTSLSNLSPPPSDVRTERIKILSDTDSDAESTQIPSKQSYSQSEVIEHVRILEKKLETLFIDDDDEKQSQRNVIPHPLRRASAHDYHPHTVVAKQRKLNRYEPRFQSCHKKPSLKLPQPNISDCIICQRKCRQSANEQSHTMTNTVIIKARVGMENGGGDCLKYFQ